jgi:hypothetical protein
MWAYQYQQYQQQQQQQQLDYLRHCYDAVVEEARRGRDEIEALHGNLRAVAMAEAEEQDQLRSQLKQQQQQLQQLQQQHAEQQQQQQQQHAAELQKQAVDHAAELAAAVAAATTAATLAERSRLRATVGPGLLVLEETSRQQRRRLAEAVRVESSMTEELETTRQLVFQLLDDPTDMRLALGWTIA